jgi:hypothetical protein
MQAHKFILIHLFAAFILMTLPVKADISSSDAPTFQVSVKPEDVERQPQPLRVFVTLGTNKFTFLAPDGFQVRDDRAQQRIILANADQTCTIVVGFGASTLESPLDADACRALLAARYPNAKIAGEFSANAASRSGLGFDLQWNGAGGKAQTARFAFIPSAVGILEFSAVGTDQIQIHSNFVMMNFRASDADGKLVVPKLIEQM